MQPIQRMKAGDMVLKQIEDSIVAGSFVPGSKLPPERELLKMLNVSRNTLREALQRAETMGLITIRHGEGTFVNTIDGVVGFNPLRVMYALDRSVFQEVVEARLIIEAENARLAAENATEDNINRLSVLIEKMGKTLKNPEEFRVFDMEFHKEIAIATQNRILPRFLYAIYDLIRKQQEKLVKLPQILEKSFAYHQKIFAAIKAKEAKEARRIMTEHISNILIRLEPIFKEEEKGMEENRNN